MICGLNWLGDGIMSMPAVQLFKAQNPDCHVEVLLKRSMFPLWEMCPAVDGCIELENGLAGTVVTAEAVSGHCFNKVFILPNSFRSAFVPFLAGIKDRIGVAGHCRRTLMNNIITLSGRASGGHQSWEYVDILGVSFDFDELPAPVLRVPEKASASAIDRLGDIMTGGRLIGIIPGAARGPSKRWPPEHYIELGRRLEKGIDCVFPVFGSAGESDLCTMVADQIGERAINLAGRTSLSESAGLLGKCSAVVCNDSGGMHLAAASGTRVVAIYGMTDSSKTGPMGKGHCVISVVGVNHKRDIVRDSLEAAEALRSIDPERVYNAIMDLLK